ncbi:hypothetical protein [Bacillus pseudomycoides]|uniref:hypothetical protein n=1 Tax=Bacillus pseudomycoides TaxID=64104 RepID=UPI000BF23BCC|nr:hypothetical protein [Bacillus pseudomycoides]PEI98669.1 hypothetical protein CN686_04670 [Bacillus pseudomycoides]PEM77452.1 hypothetical protein CN619_05245 [Bacillus pseudomycoides]PGA64084.1 hypothetical protein COL84_05130 [Bacillus pseudomycoides]PHA49680.1 hypothetical protein COE73_12385 [Bacillus pseudomycoides]PHA65366.1 hypothetical protein COE76_04750 [Bacillus pseudomycoides]
MKVTKKHVEIALIWFLSSLLCLQVSYALHTSTAITIGWMLTGIFFIIGLFVTKVKLAKAKQQKAQPF